MIFLDLKILYVKINSKDVMIIISNVFIRIYCNFYSLMNKIKKLYIYEFK